MFIVDSMRSLAIIFSIAFNVTTGRPGYLRVDPPSFFQLFGVGGSVEFAQIFVHRVLVFFVAVKVHAIGQTAHEIHHRLAIGFDERAQGDRPGDDVLVVAFGKIYPDRQACLARAQRDRRLKYRGVDVAAGEGRPPFALSADAQQT